MGRNRREGGSLTPISKSGELKCVSPPLKHLDNSENRQYPNYIGEVALHTWYTYISTSSMCTMYRLFKKQLYLEDYLLSCKYRD